MPTIPPINIKKLHEFPERSGLNYDDLLHVNTTGLDYKFQATKVADFVQADLYYDTLAELIAETDAEKVKAGKRVVTFANQNGAAIKQEWKIVAAATGTDDGGSYVDLTGSGLQAKQVFGDVVLIEQFGAYNGNSAVAVQNAINYAQSSGLTLSTSLTAFTLESAVTYPNDWVNISFKSKNSGNAYVGTEGCKVTCLTHGIIIPLKSNNHQSINISGFTFVRSGSTRADTAIKFAIDGTRPFNYPIRWNFNLSFRKWDNCFEFIRTGGAIDPDGFIGTMLHDFCNPYDCNAYMTLTGVYLNLCTIRNGRMHGLAEVVRVGGGSGAFIDFEDTHFEGVNTGGTDTTLGVITIDALSLESRFSFKNHDWENCGQLFRVDSNQTRLFDVTFTGKNRFNSYLIVDQEFKFINLANYSVDDMTIISNQSVIKTPQSVKLKTRSDTAYTSSRMTLAYIPVDTYLAAGDNYISDAIAGVRQFGAPAIGGYIDSDFRWIRPTNSVAFYSTNQAITKNHNVSGDDMYVLTTVVDLTAQSTKLGNPFAATVNGNSIQYYPNSFLGTSGQYYCVLLIKAGNGINVTDISSSVVAKGSKGISIGYGQYHSDIATSVQKLLPKTGGSLYLTRSVAASGSVVIPIRSATNANISAELTITDSDGGIYHLTACRGAANTGVKVRTNIVNSVDATKVVSVADGDAPDLCKITLTNNGASTTIFKVRVVFK